MTGRSFDFVIYGASGFTGEYVIEKLAKALEKNPKGYKWAVAGRSEARLNAALAKVGEWLGKDIAGTPLIVANSDDEDSLNAMAKQASVVLNCVGPYALYGEPVVAACVRNGTSHVDLSGEPRFLEGMQAKYGAEAAEKGCYVVGSCGWDSIPFDLGTVFMAKNFAAGQLNDVEGVPAMKAARGYSLNFGTFHSMINGVANRGDLRTIRKQIMPNRLKPGPYKPKKRRVLFFHEGAGGWCLPFLGSDKSVAERTQYLLRETDPAHRPVLPRCYFKLNTLASAIGALVWGIFFGIMALASGFTRKLLEDYPEALSFGTFSKKGPSREQVAGSSFTYQLFGRGWKGKEAEPAAPPKETIHVEVAGPEAGYEATSSFLVSAALTIREEAAAMPGNGGVLPPGFAFKDTGLVDRLAPFGISFKVVSNSLAA